MVAFFASIFVLYSYSVIVQHPHPFPFHVHFLLHQGLHSHMHRHTVFQPIDNQPNDMCSYSQRAKEAKKIQRELYEHDKQCLLNIRHRNRKMRCTCNPIQVFNCGPMFLSYMCMCKFFFVCFFFLKFNGCSPQCIVIGNFVDVKMIWNDKKTGICYKTKWLLNIAKMLHLSTIRRHYIHKAFVPLFFNIYDFC